MFHILRNHQTPPKRLHRFIFPSAIWKFWELHIHTTLIVLLSVMSGYLWPHGLQHARLPCSSLSPCIYSKSLPLSQWCQPTISSSVALVSSCPQSFSFSRSFPVSQLFTSGSQNIGASISTPALPMNIWGWLPLGLTGLISLLSKGLSRVLQHHNSKASIHWCSALTSIHDSRNGPTLTSVYDYWKYQGFDYMDLCQQSDVSAL